MLCRLPILAALAFLTAISGAAAQEKLRVVATFSILGDLARQVGGEEIEMRVLVGPEQDSHGYEPRAEDQKAVAAAVVLVANGLGFETWLGRLTESAAFTGHLVIATDGIAPLSRRDDEGGGHAGEGDHDHDHDHGRFDPHAFQDAGLVARYIDNIAAGFAAARPDLADEFRRNAAELKESFALLDAEIRSALGALPPDRRRVLTSHDAFAYFGRAYGIEFVGIQGAGMDDEPTAQDLGDAIKAIEGGQIRAVFVENMSDPRFVEALARDTGVRIGGALYADALSGPEGPAPDLQSLLRHNQKELLKALQ